MADSYSVEIDGTRVLMILGVSIVVGLFVMSAASAQLTENRQTVTVGDIEDGKHEDVDHVYVYENMSESDQALFDKVEDGTNTTISNPSSDSFAAHEGDVGVVQADGTVERVTVDSNIGAAEGSVIIAMLALGSIGAYAVGTEDMRTSALLALVVIAVSAYVFLV